MVMPVSRLVEIQAEPGAAAANCAPDRRGVFTDPGGEYDAVETTEGSGERGDLPRYRATEHVDREAGLPIVACQQLTKIRGDA